jgi:hypothetical protein
MSSQCCGYMVALRILPQVRDGPFPMRGLALTETMDSLAQNVSRAATSGPAHQMVLADQMDFPDVDEDSRNPSQIERPECRRPS